MSKSLSNRRLDSWKEIAAYLRRDERTALRWAKERGLPVQHVPGSGRRGGAFAYTDELDAWLAGRPAGEREEEPRAPRKLSRTSWVLLAAGLAAAILMFAWPLGHSGRPGQVETVRFEGSHLLASDSRGQRLWTYQLERPILHEMPGALGDLQRLTRVIDLDQDGKREVLVGVHYLDSSASPGWWTNPELLCLTSQGQVRWRHVPRRTFQFGEQQFGGPWAIYDLQVAAVEGRMRIWLIGAHAVWGTSFVEEIDPATGAAELRFLNSGVLYALGFVRNASGDFLLVGGFNNEYDAGSLAVLDVKQPFATSPQEEPRYVCQDCPAGRPYRYFVFPRSELNLLEKVAPNAVQAIGVFEKKVAVSTSELNASDRAIYEFPLDLDTARLEFSFSSTYWRRHDELHQQGKLDHAGDDCPERSRPQPVRLWNPRAGWSEISISPPALGAAQKKQVVEDLP